MNHIKPLIKRYTLLAYAGSLPFIAGAVLLLANIHTLPVLGNVTHIVNIYGVIIASFMAGVHWGQYISSKESQIVPLLITSNITAVGLWISYLWIPYIPFAWQLMIFFTALLVIDLRLRHINAISDTYFTMRKHVTLVVCAALAIIGAYG